MGPNTHCEGDKKSLQPKWQNKRKGFTFRLQIEKHATARMEWLVEKELNQQLVSTKHRFLASFSIPWTMSDHFPHSLGRLSLLSSFQAAALWPHPTQPSMLFISLNWAGCNFCGLSEALCGQTSVILHKTLRSAATFCSSHQCWQPWCSISGGTPFPSLMDAPAEQLSSQRTCSPSELDTLICSGCRSKVPLHFIWRLWQNNSQLYIYICVPLTVQTLLKVIPLQESPPLDCGSQRREYVYLPLQPVPFLLSQSYNDTKDVTKGLPSISPSCSHLCMSLQDPFPFSQNLWSSKCTINSQCLCFWGSFTAPNTFASSRFSWTHFPCLQLSHCPQGIPLECLPGPLLWELHGPYAVQPVHHAPSVMFSHAPRLQSQSQN